MLRLIVLFLTVVIAMAFGQPRMPGLFGPVAARLRAGDAAPDINYVKILHAPGGAQWSSANLSGQLTVLLFFPHTSHNLQSVDQWNALIDQFAGQPVQFAWITGELDATVLPWLEKHPIKSWVFQDPLGATGHSYGMETPELVLIGSDRRILGFDMAFVPPKQTIQAAIDGKKLRLHDEPRRMPQPEDHRPNFPPSYAVHISPAKSDNGGDYSSDDYKSLRNYTLKDVIAELYHVNHVRIQLPASLDDGKHYDFDIVLPAREDQEITANRMRQGIQDHFGITIARRNRTLDAYVVTGSDGKKPPAAKRSDDEDGMGFSSGSSIEFETRHPHNQPVTMPMAISLDDIRGVSIDGTADEFCQRLETNLDHPVVNETGWQGNFAFHVKVELDRADNFLDLLHQRLGLVITRAPRSVEIVEVAPR